MTVPEEPLAAPDEREPGLLIGLDTATVDTCVAVSDAAGALVHEERCGAGEDGRPQHAGSLLMLVERSVEAAGGWGRIGRIVVGLGPGSFTGTRIGVAAASSLAQSTGAELVGVSTLEALVLGIETRAGEAALAVLDARRGELYVRAGPSASGIGSDDVLVGPDELCARVEGAAQPLVVAGDGALRFREQLEGAGARVPPDEDPSHRLSAMRLLALGRGRPAIAPSELDPIYLRPPDAQRWIERQSR